LVQPKDVEQNNQGFGQYLRYGDRVFDFVLGHVWLYDNVSNRLSVEKQILHMQGYEFADSKPCLKHK